MTQKSETEEIVDRVRTKRFRMNSPLLSESKKIQERFQTHQRTANQAAPDAAASVVLKRVMCSIVDDKFVNVREYQKDITTLL
jgi:hypothetical protein